MCIPFAHLVDLNSFANLIKTEYPIKNYNFSRDSPLLCSHLTAKCFDFWVKVEGSTCQNVNYKVLLHSFEKNIKFCLVIQVQDFSHTW